MPTLLVEGPCGWDVEPCPDDCFPAESPAESPGEGFQDRVEAMAVDMLWRWTHQMFGSCEVTVRPCSEPVHCGRCGLLVWGRNRCGCRSLNEIVLPAPVVEVVSVWVEGVQLPADAYRVDDYAWLVRLDGDEWPRCSDLTAAPAEAGSFVVTYRYGFPPPAGHELVAGELACELSKALCNADGCRLPKRIARKTRAGVTVEFGEGLGIPSIDEWVRAVRTPRRRASVYSPDLPTPPRRTTWP